MRVRTFPAALVLVSLGAVSACSKSSPVAPDTTGAAGGLTSGSLAEETTSGSTSAIVPLEGPEQVSNLPVTWTLTIAECPALWADSITGQGTVTMKTRVTTLGNGKFHVRTTEHASGTATDSNGGVFTFKYANSLKLLEQPPAFYLTLKDHFTLNGPDKSLTFRISVDAHFKVDATGTVVFNTVRTSGPIECDPI